FSQFACGFLFQIACEAYRDEMGLFLWCRESGRRRHLARPPRRQRGRPGGDDQNRSARAWWFYDLHCSVRLLLQEWQEVSTRAQTTSALRMTPIAALFKCIPLF